MKKIILMLFFVSLCVVAISQEKSTPPPNVSETERIIDKYLDKTGEAINKIAESLKVPAERVYSILVKQEKIKGFTGLMTCILSLGLFIIGLILTKDWEYVSIPGVMSCVFGLVFFISTMYMLIGGGIAALLNPEYGAIKEILGVIG